MSQPGFDFELASNKPGGTVLSVWRTFLSEQTKHQQPANTTFLSEQISTGYQPTEQAAFPESRKTQKNPEKKTNRDLQQRTSSTM
jgi:hypothetical protein